MDDKEILAELHNMEQQDLQNLVADMHAIVRGLPDPMPRSERETKLFKLAKEKWEWAGSGIKFDDTAAVLASEKGAFVEAWVWVDDPDAK